MGFFTVEKRITLYKPAMLPVQIVASTLWAPMLVMGLLVVLGGFALTAFDTTLANDAFRAANPDFGDLQAFQRYDAAVPGIIFLGMGFLFAGITFALATILGTLRKGGGEVQVALGRQPQALRLPWTVWFGMMGMMGGLATLVASFALQAIVMPLKANAAYTGWTAGGPAADRVDDLASFQTWDTWVDPLVFIGVALMLAGITLFLYTIIIVLRFQMKRVREMANGQP